MFESAKEDGTLSYLEVSQKVDDNCNIAPEVLFHKFKNGGDE
jgi:hypothetical protein